MSDLSARDYVRFVAGWFTKMIEKFPTLQTSAFIVIALLGLKLLLSGLTHYIPGLEGVERILEQHSFDLAFSAVMMAIFFFPLVIKKKEKYSRTIYESHTTR